MISVSFEGIGLRQPLRHDERSLHGNRVDQQRERPLQGDLDGPVVRHAPGIHRFRGRLAEGVAHRPAGKARRTILRAHRFTVVPLQALAQLDQIRPAIVRHRVALGHLRLRLQAGVHAEQRVPHHPAVIYGHRRGGDDRVQQCQVGLRHEAQHARVGRLRNREPRQCRRRNASGSGPQECAPLHDVPPVDCCPEACRVSSYAASKGDQTMENRLKRADFLSWRARRCREDEDDRGAAALMFASATYLNRRPHQPSWPGPRIGPTSRPKAGPVPALSVIFTANAWAKPGQGQP